MERTKKIALLAHDDKKCASSFADRSSVEYSRGLQSSFCRFHDLMATDV